MYNLSGLQAAHVGLFALQTTGRRSVRMVMDPVEHNATKAVLHAGPGLLVALHSRTADQFDRILLCRWLSPAILVEFTCAMRKKYCEAHLAVWLV